MASYPNPVGSWGFGVGHGLEVATWGFWIGPWVISGEPMDVLEFNLRICRQKSQDLKIAREVEEDLCIAREVEKDVEG